MLNISGGFVGFFSLVSDILKDLGDDWATYAVANNNKHAENYANVFFNAAKTINGVSESLDKISKEYDNNNA